MIIYSFYRVYEPSTYSTDSSDDDLLPRAKQSKFGPQFWDDVKVERVDDIMPNDINGRKVYEVKSSGSAKLSAVRDGRNWKVRYSDCAGSHECTNPDCDFKREYGVVNRTQFDKNHICRVCRRQGRNVPCMARRYVAFYQNQSAYITMVNTHVQQNQLHRNLYMK